MSVSASLAPPGAFPPGEGEMHAAVRDLDWAETPLGSVGQWPAALRTAVSLMLDARQPMCLVWGAELVFLFNDAYAPLLGHRRSRALGRPIRDVWADIWPDIAPLIARSLAGESLWFDDLPLLMDEADGPVERFFSFSYSPLREADGRVAGMLNVTAETTAKVLADRRAQFQLLLERRLRGVEDPVAIMRVAVEALGRHLGAQRLGYGRVQPDDLTVTLETCFSDGVAPLAGDFSLHGFGARTVSRHREGLNTVCPDVRLDPDQDAAVWEAIETRAFVSVPLVRDGRFRASLFVNAREPRRWTPAEVSLIEDVAVRTWDAVERAEAERVVRAQNQRLQAMFEQAPSFMTLLEGPEHRFVMGNAAYLDLIGGRDILGRTVAEVLPEAAEQGFVALLDQVFRSGQAFGANGARFLIPEVPGGPPVERFVDFVYQPLRDAAGQVRSIFVLGSDVSERTRADRALRELNTELERRVVERAGGRGVTWRVSPFLLSVVHPSGVFEMVNPAWSATLGWTEAELVGTAFAEFLHPDDVERSRRRFAQLLRDGEPVLGFENRYRHRDGGFRWLSWVVVPEEGRFFCTAQDVSAEKDRTEALALMQEALRQSQKMEAMGQLTGGVAHDFNNLLTPILGGLDMLNARGLGNERERRLIEGALQSAERARTLVQRLLAFARRQPLQPEPVDLARLVAGMEALIAGTTGPQVALRLDLPPGLPPVKADAAQLEMAILNLVVNARDAMPEGGTLSFGATREQVRSWHPAQLARGAYVRLVVADTGEGMDEATRARAIEPFFSTKGVGRGTGLGLSMVHGLAVQLGGTVTLDSEPGAGTRVAIWLPESREDVRAAEEAAPVAAAPRSGTALLVDDEELVRMSTAFMLAELGYEVQEAASAGEALLRLDAGMTPDIVVTDHMMPGMTGAELARTLRARWPALPVLLVSGYADTEGVANDLSRLLKPFRQTELEAALRELTGRG